MSPLEILADELGAVAGRIERESKLRISAALADLSRQQAEFELRMTRMEQAQSEKMASVQHGEKGERGEKGEKGDQGEKGEKGDTGLSGERGANWCDSSAGEKGERVPVGAWTAGIHYAGMIRTHGGSTFQAARDTATEPGTTDDWVCIAERGQDARGFSIRGTFKPQDNYKALDIVACNGGSFVALKDGAGECPGADWQLLAGPGKRGAPGERGERGVPGKDGPIIVGWKHAKDFTVIPVLANGEEGPPLSLRRFFDEFLKATA